jgi:hypothetical protein
MRSMARIESINFIPASAGAKFIVSSTNPRGVKMMMQRFTADATVSQESIHGN